MSVPALEIVARYVVSRLQVTSAVDHGDGFALLSLTFDENRSFRRREARLWSLDRPWSPVIRLPIPDDARGSDGVVLGATVPPGRFLAEVAIGDDWSVPTPPGETLTQHRGGSDRHRRRPAATPPHT